MGMSASEKNRDGMLDSGIIEKSCLSLAEESAVPELELPAFVAKATSVE
jgi:hypothetical protein